MKISPISLRLNSINQKSQAKKVNFAQNSIQESALAKVSLDKMQAMNNISFKGNLNESDRNEIVASTVAMLRSPLLKQDREGRTFFHQCSYEQLKKVKPLISPLMVRCAFKTYDYKGFTPLHYMHSYNDIDKVNLYADILGDEAKEVFAQGLLAKDADGFTPLLGARNKNLLFTYALILEEKAIPVFEEALLTKDSEGYTQKAYIHNEEILDAYREILGDKKAQEIFDKADKMDEENEKRLENS